MSVYRTVKRLPRSDVHHVVEHMVGSDGHEHQSIEIMAEQHWAGRRKARPAEFLFPSTVRWMTTLPPELQPTATAKIFPRILNALAGLWSAPEELTSYFSELLTDRRGRRKGFPVRVSAELDALRAYHAAMRG